MEALEKRMNLLTKLIIWFIGVQITIGVAAGGFIVNMNSRVIENKADIKNNQEVIARDRDRLYKLENYNVNAIKVNIIMAKQELLSAQINKDKQGIYEAKKEIDKYQKELITTNNNGQVFRGKKQ